MESASAPAPYRVGRWLPSDEAFLARWLEAMIHKAHNEPRPLQPVIADFRDLIESDPAIFMLFNQMFDQVFDDHGQRPGLHAANIHVNARIATVVR